MPYPDRLADSCVFRDPVHFSSQDISTGKTLSPLSVELAIGRSAKNELTRLRGASYWSHDMIDDFSRRPIFNTRNFFLPVAFDIIG
jgi:hypothetical protein